MRKSEKVDLHLCLAASLIFMAGFFIYLWRLRPQVAFMDSMRFLGYFDDSMTGRRSLWDTWNQGEHHGILPQLVVYLNARWFGYRVFLATAASGIVIWITGLALCSWMASSGVRGVRLVMLVGLTFAALFSLSNWEIYSVDVGVALFAKNLCFVAYWIVLIRFMRTQGRGALIVLLIGGPAIILLVAFGWSYAFVFATLACLAIHRPKHWEWIVASLALSLIAYIVIGKMFPGPRMENGIYTTGRTLLNLPMAILWAISSTYIGSESIVTSGVPVIVLFVLSGFTILLALFVGIRGKTFGPQALIAYALLDAAAVAYARGLVTPSLAGAPRYFEDLSLLFVGIAWAVFMVDSIAMKVIVALLCGVFMIGQAHTAKDEWIKAPYRRQAFEKMLMLERAGLKDSDASLFQQPYESVRRAIEVQRSYAIGPFRK